MARSRSSERKFCMNVIALFVLISLLSGVNILLFGGDYVHFHRIALMQFPSTNATKIVDAASKPYTFNNDVMVRIIITSNSGDRGHKLRMRQRNCWIKYVEMRWMQQFNCNVSYKFLIKNNNINNLMQDGYLLSENNVYHDIISSDSNVHNKNGNILTIKINDNLYVHVPKMCEFITNMSMILNKEIMMNSSQSFNINNLLNNDKIFGDYRNKGKAMYKRFEEDLDILQNTQYQYTEKSRVLKIYQMMYDIDKIFSKYNLEYWAHAGTLLGSVRHSGLIPWDDDIDIAIDGNKIHYTLLFEETNNFTLDLLKLGYYIKPHRGCGYKIFSTNPILMNAYNSPYPFFDVFVLLFNSTTGRSMYFSPRAESIWHREVIYKNQVYPLKRYKFGDIEVFGPNDPNPYLNTAFGENWNRSYQKEFDHEKEASTKHRYRIKIKQYERLPAKPLGPLNKW